MKTHDLKINKLLTVLIADFQGKNKFEKKKII